MSKICIVTGASRGLGRGIALTLAREEGCTVYATARTGDALKSLAEEAADGAGSGSVEAASSRVLLGREEEATAERSAGPSSSNAAKTGSISSLRESTSLKRIFCGRSAIWQQQHAAPRGGY